MAVNADERLEIFARGSDGAAWHNWQASPGGAWVGWYSLGGGIIGAPAAAVNFDGRLDVFVLGGGNSIYHNYQTSPGGGWSGWIYLGPGNITTPPTVARNFDGRLQIFAIGTDGAVWTAYQQVPGDLWSSWTSLGGTVLSVPSVAENADGRLELFVQGNDSALWHNWQASPGGAWSGWSSLGGGIASAPAASVNDDGRVEVFAQGTDGNGWHIWQNTAGGGWSSWGFLGGPISGAPSAALDAAAGLEAFALENGVYAYVQYQSNGWAGWNPLNGGLIAAPAIATNFDGRLEIFGIGVNGDVWHDWQLSPAGAWSGLYSLEAGSNWWDTNGADMGYFVSDADDEAYYASNNGSQCSANMPNLWRGPVNGVTYAWPCAAVPNTSFVGFDMKTGTKPLSDAMVHWQDKISDWYAPYFNGVNTPNPPILAFENGGPQSTVTKRTCSTCIPGDLAGTYGRGINKNQQRDSSNRLASVEIDIIEGVTDGTALKVVFAHELGHTFGLLDCAVNATDANGNALYDCSTTVMASDLIVAGHGWDSTAQNATTTFRPSSQGPTNPFELLSGPSSCDMQIIDQHLPDYKQCPIPVQNRQMVAQCTNGAAAGFMDTGGGTGTYTCNGQACDGCNSNCNNFAPQNCGGGGGGCENCNGQSCNNMCGDVCVDGLTCQDGSPIECSGGEPYCHSTPIVIDAFGEGFHLTSMSQGVQFKVLPKDGLSQMSWTDQQFRNGWLALDRNGNGKIDDMTELFGNLTPQPQGDDPNGYVALAMFDDPMNGGNGNGVIDPGDSIYDRLILWIDANHNGISEPQEMHSLRDLGIFRIDLKYTLSRYVDANGNQFRYRAKIWDEAGAPHNTCYDVFIQVQPQQLSSGGH